MIFNNNTFRNNAAIKTDLNDDKSIKEAVGGAIYCFGYTTSQIHLENNNFFKNQAARGDFSNENYLYFLNFTIKRRWNLCFIFKYHRN